MRQGFQTVSKAVCGDDLAVIAFGRIDVVVIIVEAYLSQPYSLPAIEHAKNHASFHVQHLAPPSTIRDDSVHVAILGAAPCGTHAKAGCAGVISLQ